MEQISNYVDSLIVHIILITSLERKLLIMFQYLNVNWVWLCNSKIFKNII